MVGRRATPRLDIGGPAMLAQEIAVEQGSRRRQERARAAVPALGDGGDGRQETTTRARRAMPQSMAAPG